MGTIRSFIAIEITDGIRRGLAELQQDLAAHVPSRAVRWVDPENIHLTLKFLGDADTAAIDPISIRLEEVAATFEPFTVQLGELGCFPNPRRPRVIWVGVNADPEADGGDIGQQPLPGLQRRLERGLEELGWPAEKRRFHPHLTLGRVKDSRAVVAARFPWGRKRVSGQQSVEALCLFQSDLRPSGAVYTILKRARLAGPDDLRA